MSFAAELARREEKREIAIACIKSEIDRLSDLVASLLEVTRAETDAAANQHDFSIVDLLHEIVRDCWIEADAQRCRVFIDAAADSDLVGDRELLRRAFENIVRNGIRYTPSDSRVEVRVESSRYGAASPFAIMAWAFRWSSSKNSDSRSCEWTIPGTAAPEAWAWDWRSRSAPSDYITAPCNCGTSTLD